jgi:hypothetical protein
MHSSLIGKVHKAHQYAQEPERVHLERLEVTLHGENDDHRVTYDHGRWTCACHFFAGWGLCAHTMAIEELLGPLVPNKQTFVDGVHEPAVTIDITAAPLPVD